MFIKLLFLHHMILQCHYSLSLKKSNGSLVSHLLKSLVTVLISAQES